jgi:RimJ/RimL family protein N-acetyltransferase
MTVHRTSQPAYRWRGHAEMVYGIAPGWRGRGLASRAVKLAARCALSLPGVYPAPGR